MKKNLTTVILAVLIAVLLSSCSVFNSSNTEDEGLTASGTIASDSIRIAPEISGKVLNIAVTEGSSVKAGDELFNLDDEMLTAQVDQAQAAIDLADVTFEAAQAQLASAQVQYELVIQQMRLSDMQNRSTAWTAPSPEAFNQPIWYFEKSEQITGAQAEVDSASQNLETEQANLLAEQKNASNADFMQIEQRLVEAQMAFTVAEQTLSQAQSASDNEVLVDAAQKQMDATQAELDSAQLDYDQVLSTSAADTILEARARVAVAQARLDSARDTLAGLQTGENSLQVQAAGAGVTQAETAVSQAQANQVQAQAALDLIQLQLDRSSVFAPKDGVVLSLNFETSELVSAGSVVLTLGQLDEVNLTVYVPEDEYGKIRIGQEVIVTVDSFPGREFTGHVTHIADEAEFTPRNVQTVEGRKTTVYAVEITMPNSDLVLKPGMPADVDFNIP